jgi:hypothetical protein
MDDDVPGAVFVSWIMPDDLRNGFSGQRQPRLIISRFNDRVSTRRREWNVIEKPSIYKRVASPTKSLQ